MLIRGELILHFDVHLLSRKEGEGQLLDSFVRVATHVTGIADITTGFLGNKNTIPKEMPKRCQYVVINTI